MSAIAHECRLSTSRAENARRLMASFQSAPLARNLYLADDELDDPIEDRLLVGDVLVERHRLDTELGAQAPHGQRLESVPIGQVDGGLQNPFSAQGRAG
jgi:hypothetical protein